MTYAETLVYTLSPGEIESVRASDLGKPQRNLFEVFAANRLPKHKQVRINAATCEISETYFRKVNVLLLRDLLEILAPKGGFIRLQYLKDKDLLPLFKHELHKQLAVLGKQSEEDQRIYFRFSLQLISNFPYVYGSEIRTVLRSVTNRFYAISKPTVIDDKIFGELNILHWDIHNKQFANNDNNFNAENTRLMKIRKLFESKKKIHYLSEFYYHMVSVTFFSISVRKNRQKILDHAKEFYTLPERTGKEMKDNIRSNLKYHYVSMLLSVGEYNEPFAILSDAVTSDPDRIVRANILELFTLASILKGNTEVVERLLWNSYQLLKNISDKLRAHHCIEMLLNIALAQTDLKRTKEFLDLRHSITVKHLLHNDLLFRMNELAYYYFTGDLVHCSYLLERNFPFYYRNIPKKSEDYRLVFMKIVRARVKEIETGKPIPLNLLQQRELFSESAGTMIFGRLLERILTS